MSGHHAGIHSAWHNSPLQPQFPFPFPASKPKNPDSAEDEGIGEGADTEEQKVPQSYSGTFLPHQDSWLG